MQIYRPVVGVQLMLRLFPGLEMLYKVQALTKYQGQLFLFFVCVTLLTNELPSQNVWTALHHIISYGIESLTCLEKRW